MMRLSLDLDNKPYLIAENRARWIAYWFNTECKIYQTKNGYHVESDLIDTRYKITPERQLLIREHLGDDPRRIQLDKERIKKGWEWDVLFHSKNGTERQFIRKIKAGAYN
tara:strand:+ start:216 stop:545 length:330 start_codon:yes stop_codon:yes gene_type:complete